MMTKQIKLILAMSLQVAIIFAIIIFKLSVLSSGAEVVLRIKPVDPRDWLRGDYITFEYDISDLDSSYSHSEQIKNGDTVYVSLQQSRARDSWTARSVNKIKPIEGELFIKGKVASGGLESQIEQLSPQYYDLRRLHIVYGIEQYFIPEGKGQNFSFWNKEVTATVVIDDNGNAVLKKIYVDGKPWP